MKTYGGLLSGCRRRRYCDGYAKRFEKNISPLLTAAYEQIGLIHPGKNEDSAYRIYDGETIERIRQIIMLRKLRIPLKSIADILLRADAAIAIAVFERSIYELDEEIAALTTIRSVIKAFLDRLQISCDKFLLAFYTSVQYNNCVLSRGT